MKNKKLIIPIIICCLVIIVALVLLFINGRGEKEGISLISLDINPSIEISLTKNEKVRSVVALNDDAKAVVEDDLVGQQLDYVLDRIADKVIEKGYTDGDRVVVIVNADGDFDNDFVERKLIDAFDRRQMVTEVIKVDNINAEDEEIAKKYNISRAKASYINSIKKDNENISIDDMIDKPANELKETKERGRYCDSGYTLEGDFCSKPIGVEEPLSGVVCQVGYYDYNNMCYEEVGSEEGVNYICPDDRELNGDKCTRTFTMDADPIYECEKGSLPKDNEIIKSGMSRNICIDKTNAQAPKLRCLYNSGHIMIGGKCYNGPAPVINGGCPNGDKLVNGWCYSLDNEDQWQCPDGNIYEKSKGTYVELCPDTFTYTQPTLTGYKCPDGFEVKDKKCIREEVEDAQLERVCRSGYTLVDNGRCINLNSKISKTNGYYCENEHARLEDNQCVIYEFIEAKHK